MFVFKMNFRSPSHVYITCMRCIRIQHKHIYKYVFKLYDMCMKSCMIMYVILLLPYRIPSLSLSQVLCAVFAGDGEMVRLLVQHRADVNARLHGLSQLGVLAFCRGEQPFQNVSNRQSFFTPVAYVL